MKISDLKEVVSLEKLNKERYSYLLDSNKKIIGLNLNNIELKEIEQDILSIKTLEILNIGNTIYNKNEAFTLKFKYLNNLRHLNIADNGLSKMPKELFLMKNLVNLNISKNSLTEIPKELFNLLELYTLDLSNNLINVLPKEIFKLKKLITLDISNLLFNEFPKELFLIKNLKSLIMIGNNLKELPSKISLLNNLEVLNLGNNMLKELPKEISDLKKLNKLRIWMNEFEELPSEIYKLENLKMLDLWNNNIKKVSVEIQKLKKLTNLDLGNNELINFPMVILKLKNLICLRLSTNKLSEIPKEISKLKKLKILDFKDELERDNDENTNKIQTIPDSFAKLSTLIELRVNTYFLESFYAMALEGGVDNLKNTITQKIAQGVNKLYESKLLFVGEPGSGKTSLMEKVIDKDYKLTSPSDTVSTIGIDIKKYDFPYHLDKKITFSTNMWDFGGQQIQYMSHQFFLTPNSLYILVGDDRKQHTDFDYWFHIINLLSDNSPILVVLNEQKHKSISNFDLKYFQNLFNSHLIEKKDIDLSIMNDNRYEELKYKIELMLSNLPHIGNELPAKWIDIRNELNILSETNNFISFTAFSEISKKYGLSNTDIKTLSKHFHNLGIFLHYEEDLNGLADTIFLNSKWIMNAIYTVLASKHVNENNGKFSKKWLFDFWNNQNNNYTDSIKNKLITLMLKDKFEICYKLDATNEDIFISPQLLPSSIDYEYIWNYDNNLYYRFQYRFMPKGIISRLIVRLNNLIMEENGNELVWQKGLLLNLNDAEAQIIEKESNEGLKVIDISIYGDKLDSINLLTKIKLEIETIQQKSFRNIDYEEMIPCHCSYCIVSRTPQYHKLSTLRTYLSKKETVIKCDKSVENVNIGELIGSVINVKNEDFEILKYVKKYGINVNINNNNNNSNSSTEIKDSFNQSQSVKITISQTVSSVISSLSSLKNKLNDDEIGGVDELIKEIKVLGDNPSKEEILNSGVMTDLENLITDFDETAQDTGVLISKTEKAIKSAKSLGKTYNNLANLCGLPTIPFFLVKESAE